MTDELKQIIRDVLTLFLGGGITFAIQHWRSPQDTRDFHRDKQAETIAKQGKTLSDAFNEIDELRTTVRESDRRNRITWGYMIVLVEGYKENNIVPPDPPKELETDPELMRLINSIKRSHKNI